MKRLVACTLACALCIVLFLPGCGGEQALQPTQTLTVCIQEAFERDLAPLFSAYEKQNPGVELEVVVIPQQKELAEPFMLALRSEVMAGSGPDLFVLPANRTAGTERIMVFLNGMPVYFLEDVQRAIRAGVFCDLGPLLEVAGVDMDDFIAPIMQAGEWEGRQYVMPLAYTLDIAAVPVGEEVQAENTADFLRGLTALNRREGIPLPVWGSAMIYATPAVLDLDAATATLDEGFLTALLEANAENDDSFDYMEYEQIKQEERYELAQGGAVFGGLSPLGPTNDVLDMVVKGEGEYTLQTVPNQSGGVTAQVAIYAGVRANSENKYNAAQLLDLLLSVDAQTGYKGAGQELTGTPLLNFMPVRRGCAAAQLAACNVLLEDGPALDALLGLEDTITDARFIAVAEAEIYDNASSAYMQGMLTGPEAHEQILRELEKYLQE